MTSFLFFELPTDTFYLIGRIAIWLTFLRSLSSRVVSSFGADFRIYVGKYLSVLTYKYLWEAGGCGWRRTDLFEQP